MCANKTGGMPPELKAMLMSALAARFPGLDVHVEEMGTGETKAKAETATNGDTSDGYAQHRSHLIELVLENMEDFSGIDEVIQSADKLFQYITTGKVPA